MYYVIDINLSISIIYKNDPSIINTRSDNTTNLYFCKTVFKNFYP